MILNAVKSIFRGFARKPAANIEEMVDRANDLIAQGDPQGARVVLEELLNLQPDNLHALNNLAVCLMDEGRPEEAGKLFDLAFQLDDAFIPVLINKARRAADDRKSAEALAMLRRVKLVLPSAVGADAVYASVLVAQGQNKRAYDFHLRAWLDSFGNLRCANSLLFGQAYFREDPEKLTADHLFWANTLPVQAAVKGGFERVKRDRIRVVYWSPDLYSHSVRYFFRPLLEAHDRDRFEVIVLHDGPKKDQQTDLVRACADDFRDVSLMPNEQLADHIRDLRADILVELAGHSSFNRLNLLAGRLAAVQVTGIGYPPTTGLSTVDYKFADQWVAGEQFDRFHSERMLDLGESYWCFDPRESVEQASEPPCAEAGQITFACMGNVGKVTDDALMAWKRILDLVPGSQLIVQSISFFDQAAVDLFASRIHGAGFDQGRVKIKGPEVDFFRSYNDVDIVLDTYPFNGGTTTCFALYQGVPVVTLVGDSLISRMGYAAAKNLNQDGLIAHSWDEYVQRAVDLASNTDWLHWFRKQARPLMKQCALGSAERYARNVESAYEDALARLGSPAVTKGVQIAISDDEFHSRASRLLAAGQMDAFARVLAYWARCHPDSVTLRYMRVHEFIDRAEQSAYLQGILPFLSGGVLQAAQLTLADWLIESGAGAQAFEMLEGLDKIGLAAVDVRQMSLMRAKISARGGRSPRGAKACAVVAICARTAAEYGELKQSFVAGLSSEAAAALTFAHVRFDDIIDSFSTIVNARHGAEALIIVADGVRPSDDAGLELLIEGAVTQGIMGFQGASVWKSLHWREFDAVAGACFIKAGDAHVFQAAADQLAAEVEVVDAGMCAVRLDVARSGLNLLDEALRKLPAFMFESWLYTLQKTGHARSRVDASIGAVVESRCSFDVRDVAQVLDKLAIKHDLEVLVWREGSALPRFASIEVSEVSGAFVEWVCAS